jgi:phage regulator Rha-like protein
MIDEKLLKDFMLEEMILNQLLSWELILKKKGLKEATIKRKLNDIILFYGHLNVLKDNGEKVRIENINKVLFEYVQEGFFREDNLENLGSIGYRRAIFHNIQEGFNYIYEDYFKDKKNIIEDLTDKQKQILDDVSQNKYFKVTNIKDNKQTLQTKLIEELGIKVYFDENNKPYVYSHELAELINKPHKDVMKKLRELYAKIGQRKKSSTSEYTDFTIVEDNYKDIQNKTMPTYKIYKDLLINYILSMNGDKYFEFKINYQTAFNFIEQEYMKLLEENMKLKENFLQMYNTLRKRNRDLLILDNNKKCKKKSA